MLFRVISITDITLNCGQLRCKSHTGGVFATVHALQQLPQETFITQSFHCSPVNYLERCLSRSFKKEDEYEETFIPEVFSKLPKLGLFSFPFCLNIRMRLNSLPVTLVLIQQALDKSKFIFKFIWFATISNLFLLKLHKNANNADFFSFEKTKLAMIAKLFVRSFTRTLFTILFCSCTPQQCPIQQSSFSNS